MYILAARLAVAAAILLVGCSKASEDNNDAGVKGNDGADGGTPPPDGGENNVTDGGFIPDAGPDNRVFKPVLDAFNRFKIWGEAQTMVPNSDGCAALVTGRKEGEDTLTAEICEAKENGTATCESLSGALPDKRSYSWGARIADEANTRNYAFIYRSTAGFNNGLQDGEQHGIYLTGEDGFPLGSRDLQQVQMDGEGLTRPEAIAAKGNKTYVVVSNGSKTDATSFTRDSALVIYNDIKTNAAPRVIRLPDVRNAGSLSFDGDDILVGAQGLYGQPAGKLVRVNESTGAVTAVADLPQGHGQNGRVPVSAKGARLFAGFNFDSGPLSILENSVVTALNLPEEAGNDIKHQYISGGDFIGDHVVTGFTDYSQEGDSVVRTIVWNKNTGEAGDFKQADGTPAPRIPAFFNVAPQAYGVLKYCGAAVNPSLQSGVYETEIMMMSGRLEEVTP